MILSGISAGFITFGTIGFAFIPYYDGKIDQIREHSDGTKFKHNKVVNYIYRAQSDDTEANIIHDHIDILKKLDASKLLIEKKNRLVLKKYKFATCDAITAANMSGASPRTQLSEIDKYTMDLSKMEEIHDSHLDKAYAGLIKYSNSIASDKRQINGLRKKKGWYWLGSIILNAIGGILAIFSSCMKKEKG